ncbi:unnamed protein product [Owenia fusiformis]|uniref:Uncharacterized protein n=1 Tax=Owenia fusiformis TaxID=6347 RepID=A0A8J1URD1_OWEFU|nr:unnamed protein product [Owenia fusiformis]
MKSLVFIVLVAVAHGYVVEQTATCKTAYSTAGLSSNFNETIAHAIHSMTVEGLRLFNPKATEKNCIPTVNHNISADIKVLPYAPSDCIGGDFSTWTMNTLDKILSNIGIDDDGLGPNWSAIERTAHKFHMWDLWMKILQVYQTRVVSNPPTDDVCECLTDTDNNGIYKAVHWVADHYKHGTPITLLNRPIPKLTDAKTWGIWKQRLLWYYTEPALYDAAVYIYCATLAF